ncbi:MAG: acyltransferase [Rhizorhabdus sp.]|nr:acyltransferase [Rhizorhabdus sp.]
MDSHFIHRLIEDHRALAGKNVTSRLGLSLPDFRDPMHVPVSAENMPMLAELGIRIDGGGGSNNVVTVERGMTPIKLSIRLNNRNDNRIVVENGSRLNGSVNFEGNGHLFVCGSGGDKPFGINAMIRQHHSAIVIGRGSTANSGINLWVEGPDTVLAIGDDCLFSWGIWLRCADSHGIIDLASQKLINLPGDLELGSHSWIGQEAMVMKDVTVGAGSIVAARAVVTRSCEPCSLIAGVPGRLLRDGVSWTRRAAPTDAEIVAVVEHLRRFGSPARDEMGGCAP